MAELSPRRLFRRRPTETSATSPAVTAPADPPLPEPTEDLEPLKELPLAPRAAGPRGERTITVAVRLTPAEHARWLAAASASGRSQLGRWTRESIARQLEGRPSPVTMSAGSTAEVAALRAELSKVGSNLNQIARALNTANRGGESAPPPAMVLQAIEVTRAELGQVRDRLAEGGLR